MWRRLKSAVDNFIDRPWVARKSHARSTENSAHTHAVYFCVPTEDGVVTLIYCAAAGGGGWSGLAAAHRQSGRGVQHIAERKVV